jgi:transcriptional regulator with XRE-family HTH domain
MPRKPEINCPLRKLRLITGKSQVAFAKVLGCSPSTIKKIEAGDNSKLNYELLVAASIVFCVKPDSLCPPSTQPLHFIDGQPYTREFFIKWWKASPDQMRPSRRLQKLGMLRELEMLIAAAMRLPGMGFNSLFCSFVSWVRRALVGFDLLPHYQAEWNERKRKAQKPPNKTQADWALVQLFCEDKAKFILESFEKDLNPTSFCPDLLELHKGYVKGKGHEGKRPKPERLKGMMALTSETMQKGFQAGTLERALTTSGPKRTR